MNGSIMSYVVPLAIFVAASLPGLMVEGAFCVFQSNATDRQFKSYKCYQVSNYTKELESMEADTQAISFGYSRIPVLKNRSFDKFAESLQALIISDAETTEIEDDAFQGLRNLSTLILFGNRLDVIKGVWFNNLPGLHTVALTNNHIKTIEGSVFTTLPSPLLISLATNELNCLPREEFRTKYADITDLALQENPWDPECLTWIQSFVSEEALAERFLVSGKNVRTEPPAFEETIHSEEELCAFLETHPDLYYDCGRNN